MAGPPALPGPGPGAPISSRQVPLWPSHTLTHRAQSQRRLLKCSEVPRSRISWLGPGLSATPRCPVYQTVATPWSYKGWDNRGAGNTPRQSPALNAPTRAPLPPIDDAMPSPRHRDVQKLWRGEPGASGGRPTHLPAHISVLATE